MSDTVNAKNKRQHANKSAYYKLQFGRTEANKKRKRETSAQQSARCLQRRKLRGGIWTFRILVADRSVNDRPMA